MRLSQPPSGRLTRLSSHLPSLRLPQLQLAVRVLDLDDGAVDEHADRDRDAGQRHDVRREAEEVERNEGQEHGHRDRDDRDDRRRHMPEEEQDHEAHDHELVPEHVHERIDGSPDQVGTVVGGDDLDSVG